MRTREELITLVTRKMGRELTQVELDRIDKYIFMCSDLKQLKLLEDTLQTSNTESVKTIATEIIGREPTEDEIDQLNGAESLDDVLEMCNGMARSTA